ncbi:MAG: hypothetical protein WCP85_23620 [Mariniphaga sp.]
MENKKEQAIAVIFSIIGSLSILINLAIKDFTPENLLDAIKDLVGLLVTVAVFLFAYSIRNKTLSFIDVARASLKKMQEKMPDFLMGPRYNRDNYDPEKGKGLEYLFVTNTDPKSKLRAKLIPIQPLEEGVLAIYIQKGTLVYGLNYSSDQATAEEIKKIQSEVFSAVSDLIQRKYAGSYEILPNSKEDTAIIIDFNEEKMGKKKFSKAVTECAELAISKIRSHKK